MKKVLITGASGFVGGFLAEYLLSNSSFDVYGTYHSSEGLQKSSLQDKVHFIQADLQDRENVSALLQAVTPDVIFHLAAQAHVPTSFKDPTATFHTNIDSEIYLFENLLEQKLLNTKVLIVGSSEEYGYVQPEDLPINEATPLRPANPYAVSKIAQDYIAFQYMLSHKVSTIRVRPFNHIGPRQKAGYVIADFAKQIAAIEKGNIPPVIKVGNLHAKRDFTDVRDTVRAYALLMEKGTIGEVYNIGSGVSHSIQDMLTSMLSLSTKDITIEVDETKMRPSDIPEIVCDNTKIRTTVGWEPEISIKKTLTDTLDYWRNIV